MADWKQITARIRRARTGKDPAGQLTNLFSKTRDGMVAFELARYFEVSGNTADAGRWYVTAAERFRRADWKIKAQESATRLGATEPAEIPPAPPRTKAEPTVAEVLGDAASPSAEPVKPVEEPLGTQRLPERAPRTVQLQGRPRRSRRGGTESRVIRAGPEAASSKQVEAATIPGPQGHEGPPAEAAQGATRPAELPAAPALRGRFGDPGLSSRLSQLEMNFRRLLAASPCPIDSADKAPAGPGVWVLTDSDLTTYYYVEPCDTLRVAIPNLLRSGSSRKGESIRPRLAEYLGVPESRVAKYVAEHCVVRWLQMDEDAGYFAHFLIAVLRPTLNK